MGTSGKINKKSKKKLGKLGTQLGKLGTELHNRQEKKKALLQWTGF
jgi:hypothetical protein